MFPSPGGSGPPTHELFAGRYTVDGRMPWGGLVPYYRAATEGTPVIVCVLPMDVSRSSRAEAAFSRLTQRLGLIRRNTLPRVFDAGVIDGVPYITFQDTRGTALSAFLRNRSMPSMSILRIACDVLRSLEAAHRQGLVHGDLTPENVLVGRDRTGALRARVIGTGIVPLLRAYPEASAPTPSAGSGRHAVAYMAPELFGTGAFPRSADVYAVGAMLHHMVMGSPPIGWESEEGFEDIPGLPDVVRKAMAKQPSSRYPDARSMIAALEWLEVESAKLNPSTQDIAPWMESSRIGSVPVPTLASSVPPAHLVGSYEPGKVLQTSAPPRRSPIPILFADSDARATGYWLRIVLLLTLLGVLMFSGYWWGQPRSANPEGQPSAPLAPEHAD